MIFFTLNEERHLNRRLTPLNVWSLAFGCVIGWSAFVMPGMVFLKSAGPLGTLLAMEIATFVMLIISYNYNYMIQKFPLTGGEFIYAKMAFGVSHGFWCAWFLSLSYLSVIPLNATALNLIMRTIAPGLFQQGFFYEVAGYEVYLVEILLAIFALVVFMLVNSLGIQVTGKLQTLMVMILLGGLLIIMGSAILSPKVTSSNLSPMFHPQTATYTKGILAQIIAVMVTGPQSFVGFDTVPQLMEESNFSPNKVKVVMDTSIICGGFVYIGLTLVACSVFPEAFSDWVEYNDALPTLKGIQGMPTLNAASMLMGKTGLSIIVCSVLAAILTGIVGFYTATSRLLYSMARDGMIPSWFNYLNKNGVPTHAGLFCTVVSALLCLFGRSVMGWVFDMASIGASIGFAYTSLAAFKYARHEKRIDIEIFGALGFVLSLLMGFLLLVPLPGLHVSLSFESYMLFLAWIIMGCAFYIVRQKEGYSNN